MARKCDPKKAFRKLCKKLAQKVKSIGVQSFKIFGNSSKENSLPVHVWLTSGALPAYFRLTFSSLPVFDPTDTLDFIDFRFSLRSNLSRSAREKKTPFCCF